jgi:tetratricopeptide (TPR) repeat protein
MITEHARRCDSLLGAWNVSYKDYYADNQYEILYQTLSQDYDENIYSMIPWHFFYYVKSGYEIKKNTVTFEFIRGYFDYNNDANVNPFEQKAFQLIKWVYLSILKDTLHERFRDNYDFYSMFLTTINEHLAFLRSPEGDIEHHLLLEVIVLEYANKYVNNYKMHHFDNEFLNLLNQFELENFSDQVYKTKNTKNREVTHASNRERLLVIKVKLLYDLGRFQDVIDAVDLTFTIIREFHYQNDMTILRKKAASYRELGLMEDAKRIMAKLLQMKPDWYIYSELALIDEKLNDKKSMLKHCLMALLCPFGDTYGKVKVINRVASLTQDSDRDYSQQLYQLECELRIEKGWSVSSELDKRCSSNGKANKREIFTRSLDKLYQIGNPQIGAVKKIFPNGRGGFVDQYYFSKSNFVYQRDNVTVGDTLQFIVIDSFDKRGNPAKEAAFIRKVKS